MGLRWGWVERLDGVGLGRFGCKPKQGVGFSGRLANCVDWPQDPSSTSKWVLELREELSLRIQTGPLASSYFWFRFGLGRGEIKMGTWEWQLGESFEVGRAVLGFFFQGGGVLVGWLKTQQVVQAQLTKASLCNRKMRRSQLPSNGWASHWANLVFVGRASRFLDRLNLCHSLPVSHLAGSSGFSLDTAREQKRLTRGFPRPRWPRGLSFFCFCFK